MSQRLVEVVVPEGEAPSARELGKEHPVSAAWIQPLTDGMCAVRFVAPSDATEALLDALEHRFGGIAGFHVVIVPVEASLPRPKEQPTSGSAAPSPPSPERISREELYADVEGMARLSRTFLLILILSAIVAAIGLERNNVAVVIGAMVIAPLLGPIVGLSLAATLGDSKLARRAMLTMGTGVLIAFALAFAWGSVWPVDPKLGEIVSRTRVHVADLVLAIASGCAGAIALTRGAPGTLIGVMVAVALLPPLVAAGLLLGSGHHRLAVGALLLFAANFICVNLAGVATFLARGIRPRTFWESTRARRATRLALALWLVLFAALALVLVANPAR